MFGILCAVLVIIVETVVSSPSVWSAIMVEDDVSQSYNKKKNPLWIIWKQMTLARIFSDDWMLSDLHDSTNIEQMFSSLK